MMMSSSLLMSVKRDTEKIQSKQIILTESDIDDTNKVGNFKSICSISFLIEINGGPESGF